MASDLEFVLEMDHQRVPLDMEMELFVGKIEPSDLFHEAKSGSTSKKMELGQGIALSMEGRERLGERRRLVQSALTQLRRIRR
ncbi:hypothetical protein NL676_007977 [Syzygium grande]|nr:hypothetical protein NL676_007977 [Syzygium grande]